MNVGNLSERKMNWEGRRGDRNGGSAFRPAVVASVPALPVVRGLYSMGCREFLWNSDISGKSSQGVWGAFGLRA